MILQITLVMPEVPPAPALPMSQMDGLKMAIALFMGRYKPPENPVEKLFGTVTPFLKQPSLENTWHKFVGDGDGLTDTFIRNNRQEDFVVLPLQYGTGMRSIPPRLLVTLSDVHTDDSSEARILNGKVFGCYRRLLEVRFAHGLQVVLRTTLRLAGTNAETSREDTITGGKSWMDKS